MTPLDRYRWASGRRRYNKMRQQQQEARRWRVWAALTVDVLIHHGGQARLARQFGVHRSTISRDIAAWWERARRRRLL